MQHSTPTIIRSQAIAALNPRSVEHHKAMRDMNKTRLPALLMLAVSTVAVGCGSDNSPSADSAQAVATGQAPGIAGQSGGVAGRAGASAAMGPMPGLGTIMMMSPAKSTAGATAVATGAAGALASGSAGHAGASAGSSGSAGAGAGAVQTGAAGSHAAAGAAGSGMSGGAGASGGGAPADGLDPTSVCMGGKPGMDSDAVMTRAMTSSRNFSLVYYLVQAPNKISRFQTILPVPKVPAQRSTLFIWPGLQHSGGSDPAALGNGVLQPVLTWGPSCNPKASAKGSNYMGWWISGMYVNVSSLAAGPGGCAGGDSMDVSVTDRLYIDFAAKGNEWTQSVVNLTNMKKVDYTIDLKGQDQNWAIWDIETPGGSVPAEDTFFEKSVLTFTSPVTTCQPSSAAEVDYFSAPILSPDGLNCCIEKMILKAKRN